jgi:hypothetical protein
MDFETGDLTMRRIDGTWPPPDVLKAIRAHARGRLCTRRALTRREALSMPLSKLMENGTADDIRLVIRVHFWFGLRHAGAIRHRQIAAAAMLKRCRLVAAEKRKRAHQSVRDIVEALRRDEEAWERRLAFARARSILRTVGPVVINRLVLARARSLAEDLAPDATVLVRRGLRERVLTPEHLRTGDVILDWSDPERRAC